MKDQARNIAENQALLRGMFQSAAHTKLLAPGGHLQLTLKRGEPYDSWNAVVLAKLEGFKVHCCTNFDSANYPGYAHRRTIGDEHAGNDDVSSGKTYSFMLLPPKESTEVAHGIPGKMMPTGQTYKEAWKQRHKKGRRP